MERIYHTWDKWECFPAGFWNTTKEGMKPKQCEQAYGEFLADADLFASVLSKVIKEWKYSCEHNLTNETMNRVAWMGQAALAYHLGIPSCYRAGFNLLSEDQQQKANAVALEYINKWLDANGHEQLDANGVKCKTKGVHY